MSFFDQLPEVEENSLFDTKKIFDADKNPNKINASMGIIFNEEGNKLEKLAFIEEIEEELFKQNLDKEYSTLLGNPKFNESIFKLIFPNESSDCNIIRTQSMTGGSALKISSEIIREYISDTIYLSNKTFSLYYDLFRDLKIEHYPYYDSKLQDINFSEMKNFLMKIPNGSVINLQVSGHNPTGLDLNQEQWTELASLFLEKNHLAFFDLAYLPYATGDIESDIVGVRTFRNKGLEFILAYSSGKQFMNYCNDVGGLFICVNDKDSLVNVKGLLAILNRAAYSFSSLQGSRIIDEIIRTKMDKLNEENKRVFNRISKLRGTVIDQLANKGIKESFVSFLKKQRGIYIYLDLSNEEVNFLKEKHSIYLADNGRVNLTSICSSNINYFIDSICNVLKNK